MIIVYGIKNCDTVKKALKWLTEHNIEHKLHDYRVDGLDAQFLQQAEAQFGWDNLVSNQQTKYGLNESCPSKRRTSHEARKRAIQHAYPNNL